MFFSCASVPLSLSSGLVLHRPPSAIFQLNLAAIRQRQGLKVAEGGEEGMEGGMAERAKDKLVRRGTPREALRASEEVWRLDDDYVGPTSECMVCMKE